MAQTIPTPAEISTPPTPNAVFLDRLRRGPGLTPDHPIPTPTTAFQKALARLIQSNEEHYQLQQQLVRQLQSAVQDSEIVQQQIRQLISELSSMNSSQRRALEMFADTRGDSLPIGQHSASVEGNYTRQPSPQPTRTRLARGEGNHKRRPKRTRSARVARGFLQQPSTIGPNTPHPIAQPTGTRSVHVEGNHARQPSTTGPSTPQSTGTRSLHSDVPGNPDIISSAGSQKVGSVFSANPSIVGSVNGESAAGSSLRYSPSIVRSVQGQFTTSAPQSVASPNPSIVSWTQWERPGSTEPMELQIVESPRKPHAHPRSPRNQGLRHTRERPPTRVQPDLAAPAQHYETPIVSWIQWEQPRSTEPIELQIVDSAGKPHAYPRSPLYQGLRHTRERPPTRFQPDLAFTEPKLAPKAPKSNRARQAFGPMLPTSSFNTARAQTDEPEARSVTPLTPPP